MTNSRTEGPDALVAPLYFVAFLLVATPVMDFVTSIVPLRVTDIEWRFASVGLLSGFVLTPVLGVILAMAVAQFAGHLRFQRVIAIVNLVAAGVFALLLLAFALDVLQLGGAVQSEAKTAFSSAATKAFLKHASYVIASGFLGVRGLRVSRWKRDEPKRTPASILVG